MQPANKALSHLDPNVARCAKQVYTNLQLVERISLLSKTTTIPSEVDKMSRILSYSGKERIDKITRGFLVWSPPNNSRKKNLADFLLQLDKELETYVDDELDFGFDDDLDEDILSSLAEQPMTAPAPAQIYPQQPITTTANLSKKRTIDDEASGFAETSVAKKLKPTLPLPQPRIISGPPLTISPDSRIILPKTTAISTTTLQSLPPLIKPLPHQRFAVDSGNSDAHNIICSPSGGVKLFNNVEWITLYEISRFVQSCNIPWNELPFDAFQMFLNTANSEPKKLYDTMMQWNQEVRLGLKLNGLAYTSMERCPENVWSYIAKMKALEKTGSTSTTATSTTTSTSNNSNSNGSTLIQARSVAAMSPISPTPSTLSTSAATSPQQQAKSLKKQNGIKNRMIHFSGILQFKVSNIPPSITLRAPKVEASNRLFRKFGHDRFLELKLSRSSKLFLIREHRAYFLKPFLFMHRVFRFLFIKDDTVILFATEGVDLKPISIQQVIDWHMPITENWSMSMSKYASRMSLGYSSSIPTLEFKPEQIRYIDDVYADTGRGAGQEERCMTDGCGIISPSAMKLIMGCQATDQLPCAIQGRIAGAKGIWIISPDLDFSTGNWIEIRKSQDKFKTGLPQDDLSLDPLHYTFDLVKNSICVYPSNLNTQFIQSLAAGGVPTEVFVDILKEYVHRLANIVTENQNIKVLRDWVAKTGNIMDSRWEGEDAAEKGLWNEAAASSGGDENDSGFFSMNFSPDVDSHVTSAGSSIGIYGLNDDLDDGETYSSHVVDGKVSTAYPVMQADAESRRGTYNKINRYSGFPAGLHESIIRLLDAGFNLSNAYIATRVTMVFRQVMRAITVKYKIEVPQSCTVTCVPDPTGTLEAGEVFLQLTSRKTDEKTGIRAGQILGDVIVTRNPCGLKSDVQKVKAVDCTALRMYTDIIIFSVKGEVSLASQLSGGDYDGDIVFCCWDERIVEPFNSSSVPVQSPRVNEAFKKDSSTLGGEIGNHANPEQALQNSFISVTLPDGTLGQYENWRTVLAEHKDLDDPDVIYLAQMCAKLVDAPKQGLKLTEVTKKRDIFNFSSLAHPQWFMDKKNKQRDANMKSYKHVNNVYTLQDAPCVTTMDYLYDTLLKETAAFTKYSRSLFCDEDVPFKDSDLTAPWIKACELATQLGDKALKDDLDLIAKSIRENRDAYSTQCGEFQQQRAHYMDNIRNPSRYLDNKFVDELQSRFNNYLELEEYFAKDFNESPATQNLRSSIIIFDIQANGGKMLQNIKASYAYTLSVSSDKYSKYCYIVAYDAMRRIKADACAKLIKENGLAETVAVSAYKAMSLDRKWLKKVKETSYVDRAVEKVRLIPDLNINNLK